ncbi:MAG: VWA domain-containing protein [Phycisphaerales bacterium]|nr:VWA domain-containing protein [Phycisphaerales bacterium]
MDIRFLHLEALHWLWAVLVVGAVLVIGGMRRRARLAGFADAALLRVLVPDASSVRRAMRSVVLVGAMLALVAAMIDPRWGSEVIDVPQRGVDVMVILDVSRSMLAEDASPNRLARSKQFIMDMVDRMAGDRVGLITSAGRAALRCPLTIDYGAFRLSLDEAVPEQAGRGGSLLGDAIRLAGRSFGETGRDQKVIVLFSDGEDHGSYPREAAAKLFEDDGVRLYTVGIGDSGQGSPIPVTENGRRRFLTYDDEEVVSRMDPRTLTEMALAAGGAFVPAGTSQVDFGDVYDDLIVPLATTERDMTRVRRYTVRYQWFAGLALLLLLIESCITDRRARNDGGTI